MPVGEGRPAKGGSSGAAWGGGGIAQGGLAAPVACYHLGAKAPTGITTL